MFISKKMVVLCYMDDYATAQSHIEDILETFRTDGDNYNWEMKVKGSVNDFLSINLHQISNKWHLTQE